VTKRDKTYISCKAVEEKLGRASAAAAKNKKIKPAWSHTDDSITKQALQ